jgi:hypothetical protein
MLSNEKYILNLDAEYDRHIFDNLVIKILNKNFNISFILDFIIIEKLYKNSEKYLKNIFDSTNKLDRIKMLNDNLKYSIRNYYFKNNILKIYDVFMCHIESITFENISLLNNFLIKEYTTKGFNFKLEDSKLSSKYMYIVFLNILIYNFEDLFKLIFIKTITFEDLNNLISKFIKTKYDYYKNNKFFDIDLVTDTNIFKRLTKETSNTSYLEDLNIYNRNFLNTTEINNEKQYILKNINDDEDEDEDINYSDYKEFSIDMNFLNSKEILQKYNMINIKFINKVNDFIHDEDINKLFYHFHESYEDFNNLFNMFIEFGKYICKKNFSNNHRINYIINYLINKSEESESI